MPEVFKEDYGKRQLPDGSCIEVVPTTQKFFESDGSDVRLDRVYVLGSDGRRVRSYLQDKMGRRFADNLPDAIDDLTYLDSLPSRERK